MDDNASPAEVGTSEGLGPTSPEPDLLERLKQRTLPKHGGRDADSWSHHWNLTHGDSLMHREAITEIERLRALLERSKRGEHICLKCGLRQDGYDAAAHASAYPGF